MPCGKDYGLLESGTSITVNAGLVLSSATDLELTLVKPNGDDSLSKTLSGAELSIGTVDYTDPITLEVFTAFEYIDYPVEVGVLDTLGPWCGKLNYKDSTTTPVIDTPGCEFTFNVIDIC